MDKITCSVCSRLNDPRESRCWFCSAELNPTPPASSDDKSWLSGMKEDLNAGQGNLEGDIPPDIGVTPPDEQIPEWLARIRAREAAEREAQAAEDGKDNQKKSQGGIPDWLNSIEETSDIPVQDGEPFTRVSDQIEPESDSLAVDNLITPHVGNESDWTESLKTWETDSIQDNHPDSEKISVTSDDIVLETTKVEHVIDSSPLIPADEPVEQTQPLSEELDSEELGGPQEDKIVDPLFEMPAETELNVEDSQLAEEFPTGSIPEGIKDNQPQLVGKNQLENEPWQTPEYLHSETMSDPDISNVIETSLPQAEPEIVTYTPSELNTPEAVASQSRESVPFNPDDLPDWLNEKQPDDSPQPPQKQKMVQPVIDNSLPKPEKANLPAWLEAKRPIEAVELAAVNPELPALEKTDEILSSLESPISGSLSARVAGKPSDLGSGLKLTERQKANAALLSSIIGSSEASVDEKPHTVEVKRNVLWRILFALVLIILILLGGTTLKDYALQPALFPEEVVHTFDQINSLPVEKPVLIAADFEAALAGEIRLSSKSLIEHLMRRNLAITLISTNPVDTALLSSQISSSMQVVPAYLFTDRVVDLGYLPGGAIAVQSLNGDFQAAVPMTADLTVTSTHALLSSIRSLQDFGALIVITDDSESARVWIEQIQPQILTTPLLLVTSAQAAPLIQPYYQSGQLAGLVAGMPGGLVYERIMQTNGEASDNLSSLQLVSIVMAGMILVGGFISLVKPAEFGSNV